MAKKNRSKEVPTKASDHVALGEPTGWRAVFNIDVRSLALFRVAIAGLVLCDLFLRSFDIHAFYTDDGVLPRSLLLEFYRGTKIFWTCVHLCSGSAWWQVTVFGVFSIFALMLLCGYRTRLATVGCWLLALSIQNRNPMILQAGDTLLRVLLFWSIFLPLGARFSVDAALDKSKGEPPKFVCSIASAALLLQMTFMYFFSFLLKDGATWKEGTALYYALSVDQWTRPLGIWIRQFTQLNTIATHSTLLLEGIGPFLPFIPFYNARLRVASILLFSGLHAGIAMTMALGLFSYVSIAGWLPFLPASFWDFIASKTGMLGRDTTINSDGGHEGTDKKVAWKTSRSVQCFVAFCLLYVFAWNVRTTNFDYHSRYFPPEWNTFGRALGISQYWNMFAPNPSTTDGWFIIAAMMEDGSEIDIYNEGKSLTWGKPEVVCRQHKNMRWRKYMMNLKDQKNQVHREPMADYFYRTWNQKNPDRTATRIGLGFARENTPPPGKPLPQPVPIKLLDFRPGSYKR